MKVRSCVLAFVFALVAFAPPAFVSAQTPPMSPSNWPRATLVDMMNMHLSTTTNEVVASDGIVKQFPDKLSMK